MIVTAHAEGIKAERLLPLARAGNHDRGPFDAIRLPGEHNLSNVCAAVAVGLLYGIEPDAITGAVADFAGYAAPSVAVATVLFLTAIYALRHELPAAGAQAVPG